MRQGSIAFLLGVLAAQQLVDLPRFAWPAWTVLLVVLVGLAIGSRRLRLPAIGLAGWVWVVIQAKLLFLCGVPPDLEGRTLTVEGVVVGLPEPLDRHQRFVFAIERVVDPGLVPDAVSGRVRVSWYGRAPAVKAGERWRLPLRLKRPHGFSNPGGFDYERWLFQQRIRATGYVVASGDAERLAAPKVCCSMAPVRQRLLGALDERLADHPFRGVVVALALGERQGIDGDQWRVLSRTGTSHLVAISGLHIGLAAGFGFFFVRWGWSRLPRAPLWLAAPRAAALAAILVALVYAALAGFSLPTQRALIMVAVAMSMIYATRNRALVDALFLALWLVLIIDPFAVLSAGFWLSFAAVALIFYVMAFRLRPTGWWWRWGRLHWLISIGLAPLLLLFFSQAPLLSPLANFFAVPFVGLLVVPLVLAAVLALVVLPVVADPLLRAAAAALEGFWPLLEWMARADGFQFQVTPPGPWAMVAAIGGIILLLMPRGVPGRWLGVVWLVPICFAGAPRPAEGEAWFTLLDVGQGLAAAVQTRDHVLVYDTGPRYSAQFDAGAGVILPFLRQFNRDHLDIMMIGHGDSDHIGGAEAVQAGIAVSEIVSSVPGRWGTGARYCREGQRWRWDGVDFQVLHPSTEGAFRGNDASCVLRISTAAGAILLTGDIEAAAERALLARHGSLLRAQVLVAPHHGSNTSSTAEFIRTVAPRVVLYPVGYRNRYGFPRPQVALRYRAAAVQEMDTARHGAITVVLPKDGPPAAPQAYRRQARRYWHSVVR